VKLNLNATVDLVVNLPADTDVTDNALPVRPAEPSRPRTRVGFGFTVRSTTRSTLL
jgi:hypothetical protein